MGIRRNLVLGGSGTIGSALCKRLLEMGEEVINLDLKVGYDLRNYNLSKYSDMDYVWFFAWEVGGARFLYDSKYQLQMLVNNTLLCENIFAFLERSKVPFMFASSQLISPDMAYGTTKLLGEKWTQLLNGKIVRFWNVYAWEEPALKSHFIPDIVCKALVNGEIKLMTNGTEERQLIYVDDCINNLLKARDLKENNIHITDGNWIKIADLASMTAKKLNVKLQLGELKGYDCKIEPNETHRLFDFPTSISNGIDIIIEKAKEYLRKN